MLSKTSKYWLVHEEQKKYILKLTLFNLLFVERTSYIAKAMHENLRLNQIKNSCVLVYSYFVLHALGIFRNILLVGYFVTLCNVLFAQLEPSRALDSIGNDAIKEEIQRYFGYENVLFRYTTLPYDVSLNTNETATFLDIGFLYIIFLPLILVFLIAHKKSYKILGAVGLIFYLLSCFYFSKVQLTSHGQLVTKDHILSHSPIPNDNTFIDQITIGIYKIAIPVFDGIFQTLDSYIYLDQLTYPFIFLCFFTVILLALQIQTRSIKNMVIIYLCFSLLFFLLSAGIVWYGFFMVPTSLIILFYLFEKNDKTIIRTYLKSALWVLTIFWISLCFVLRISNIQPSNTSSDKGTNLFFPNVFSYSLGQYNEAETLDLVYPNISSSLEEINSNDDLIFKVGTSFSLHIKNNNNRVVNDNQLSKFFNLYQRYGNAANLFSAMKAYGFSYLIIDLHTSSIDKTPDKSLTKKYQLLLESIFNNPDLYLMNTDRKIEVKTANGINVVNAIFGNIQYFGNYAVFKII